MKKILYIDMDNVLVDFESAFKHLSSELLKQYKGNEDDIPGIFSLMEPKKGAIMAFNQLSQIFDTYILSTAPWNNPSAWTDKLLWVKKYLGDNAYKKLIISHHKNLNHGDYLIDDRLKNGVVMFKGEHLHFGKGKDYQDWNEVINYLLRQNKIDNLTETIINFISMLLNYDCMGITFTALDEETLYETLIEKDKYKLSELNQNEISLLVKNIIEKFESQIIIRKQDEIASLKMNLKRIKSLPNPMNMLENQTKAIENFSIKTKEDEEIEKLSEWLLKNITHENFRQ